MPDAPELLFDYQKPSFRYGDIKKCARRGSVRIVGLSDAPIPWPIGQRLPRGRARSLVVYGALARAVRRESVEAVCYWWGVGKDTVWQWRKALGVGEFNEGTRWLKSVRLSPVLERAREAARPTLSSRERGAKIAWSKRGKPRPPHVIEAMRQGRTGKPHSEEARRKMSEAHRRRGALVPGTVSWTPQEDEWVRTLPAKEAARKTGRTLVAVYSRRRVLELPDGRSSTVA
jgi:hypothetical protein